MRFARPGGHEADAKEILAETVYSGIPEWTGIGCRSGGIPGRDPLPPSGSDRTCAGKQG
ncbi:MAG: hypothetical protein QMC96_08575 [Methanomicrobiales archaeon]|nr:hypothetical protein [Methanomicrobiales archaeon]